MLLILPKRRKQFAPLTGGLTDYHNVMLPLRLLAAMHIENMSIRAHRIVTLEYAQHPSFNCDYETGLLDFLMEGEGAHDGRNDDGSGIMEVAVERLQEAIENRELKLDEGTRDEIEADVVWATQNLRDFITYDCF